MAARHRRFTARKKYFQSRTAEVGLTSAGKYRNPYQWSAAGINKADLERKAYYGAIPDVHKGHFEEIEAFARAILEGQPSPCDEIDGARATACCQAAVECMESGFMPVALWPQDYFLERRRSADSSFHR